MEIFEEVNRLLKGITHLTTEGEHFWEEAAIWADVTPTRGMKEMYQWHFVDIPIHETKETMNFTVFPENATWSIHESINTLKIRHRSHEKEYLFEKSLFLRFFFHFIGDLHQPLHASERFVNGTGDAGGNGFKIKFDEDVSNLHALWDSCLKSVPNDYEGFNPPISEEKYNQIVDSAQEVMEMFPYEQVKDKVEIEGTKNKRAYWEKLAWESHDLSIATVYDGIEENEYPSEEYLARGRHICKQQMAYAGYRLSNQLRNIFWVYLQESE